jgi:hypothetical protein
MQEWGLTLANNKRELNMSLVYHDNLFYSKHYELQSSFTKFALNILHENMLTEVTKTY